MKNTMKILLGCLFFWLNSNSQICEDIELHSELKNLITPKRNEVVECNINLNKLKLEDAKDSISGKPVRFGIPFKTNFNLENSGDWIIEENGDKTWFLTISLPNAKSINLVYDKFWLPIGTTLHIYNKNKTQVIGAFTHKNNKGSKKKLKGFSTGLLVGDTITLEYFIPNKVLERGVISICNAIYGYKRIKFLENFYLTSSKGDKSFGSSENCNVNINCNEGNSWQDEKLGVGLLIPNGTHYCSGSLINSTANDGKLYFLTANHCISGHNLDAVDNPDTIINETESLSTQILWNFESNNCDNGFRFTPQSIDGIKVLSNRSDSDFALLELLESPIDIGINPFFNGWDCRNTTSARAVGIHHPRGDIKKISIENNPITSTSYYSNSTNNNANHWRVANWDVGVTEGGSSGSPLFNNDSRIIGQLHGGDAACSGSNDNNKPDWYGKLYSSWDGPSPQRRLKDWLDPLNTGAFWLDGKYLNDPHVNICGGVSDTYVNQTFSQNNTIQGCNVNVTNSRVINNSTLVIDVKQNLKINGTFKVETGSILRIN